jgi:hypothetical protein
MPGLSLADADDDGIAKPSRNGERCGPLQACTLAGQPVCTT